jgi:hypothetical protein
MLNGVRSALLGVGYFFGDLVSGHGRAVGVHAFAPLFDSGCFTASRMASGATRRWGVLADGDGGWQMCVADGRWLE